MSRLDDPVIVEGAAMLAMLVAEFNTTDQPLFQRWCVKGIARYRSPAISEWLHHVFRDVTRSGYVRAEALLRVLSCVEDEALLIEYLRAGLREKAGRERGQNKAEQSFHGVPD